MNQTVEDARAAEVENITSWSLIYGQLKGLETRNHQNDCNASIKKICQ